MRTGCRMKIEWIPDSELYTGRSRAGGEDEDTRKKRTDAENNHENATRDKINPAAS
jgi:hypothetical protein